MREEIDAVIEPIVAAAQIPSHRRRDELRRELRGHFEDSGLTPEALQDAVARFRNTARVLMLWASTITIVAFSDRAFVSAFRTT